MPLTQVPKPGLNSYSAMPTAGKYTAMPTLDQWRKDSSVTFARRGKDAILSRIDSLLQTYAMIPTPDTHAQTYTAGDLYFVLDNWLKLFKHERNMDKGRYDAVMNLYAFVVAKLCRDFGAALGAERSASAHLGADLSGGTTVPLAVNNLPAALELFYGRTLSEHGAWLDLQMDCATYLTRAEAAKYKLRFRDGLAYQYPWWDTKPGKALVPADSFRAYDATVFQGNHRKDWGGFAMSMSRDIYMAKHHCTTGFGENGNFYHSSYMAGDTVQCAGTMWIEAGVIRGIANDSGHYKPHRSNLVNLLDTLQMFKVNIAAIDVQWYDQISKTIVNATAANFLHANGDWNALVARKAANVTNIAGMVHDEQAFADHIWGIFEQGVRNGHYRDDPKSRSFFVAHILSMHKDHQGRTLDGHSYQHCLAALARASSRLGAPGGHDGNWCVAEWRRYLKGDTGTKRNGEPNSRATVTPFATHLIHTQPGWSTVTQKDMEAWVLDNLKVVGHQFDS